MMKCHNLRSRINNTRRWASATSTSRTQLQGAFSLTQTNICHIPNSLNMHIVSESYQTVYYFLLIYSFLSGHRDISNHVITQILTNFLKIPGLLTTHFQREKKTRGTKFVGVLNIKKSSITQHQRSSVSQNRSYPLSLAMPVSPLLSRFSFTF